MCPNCGLNKIAEQSFCAKCGFRFEAADSPPKSPTPKKEDEGGEETPGRKQLLD